MSDTTYVDYTTPAVNAAWLNEINDHVWNDSPVTGTIVHDASKIAYLPDGISAVPTTVRSKLRSLELADYTALRAFTGNETHVQIIGTEIAGLFKVDASDTTSADNGGTIIVDATGRRWKRVYVGEVHVDWFASGDGTNESAKIQAALNAGGKKTIFSGKLFIAENLTVPAGTELEFRGTTMRFPDVATAYACMFLMGAISTPALIGPFAATGRVLVSGKKSNGTYQASGKLLRGFYVIGAKDVDISGVSSDGLPDGFAIHVAQSYADGGNPICVPERISISSVSASNIASSGGPIAITAGKHISIRNSTSFGGGSALVMESDFNGPIEDVYADTLVGRDGACAFNITAHRGAVRGVCIDNFVCLTPSATTKLAPMSYDLAAGVTPAGSIKNVSLRNGYIDGGYSGIYTPNNIFIENLVATNVHARNCAADGYRTTCSGTFTRVSAKNCAINGFVSASMPLVGSVNEILTFNDCDFSDNNGNSATNVSGIHVETIANLVLINTACVDSRGTPLQKYGVFFAGTSLTLINSRLSGNAVGRYNLISGTLNDFSSTDTGSYMCLNPLNLALFGAGSFGNGAKVTFIANATTIPTANPTGGGILYVEAGALKYRGSSGTLTTLGPA